MKYAAILFDLDGTLVDSAPDLVNTLNDLLADYQRPQQPFHAVRDYVSYGSTKLLEIGFNKDYPLPFATLRQAYLDKYQQQSTRQTNFFDGILPLLEQIEKSQTPWGIITNKPTAPTLSIAKKLQLDQRAAAIVCGDTLPVAKPDPSPLILATEMMGVNAKDCVYIGDCDRDITAGKLAEMATIACQYGYICPDDKPIETWGADAIAKSPKDLLAMIQKTQ